jgi:hypothetical protein
MQSFWEEALHGILTEYLYVNRSRLNGMSEIHIQWGREQTEKIVADSEKQIETQNVDVPSIETRASRKVLVPIGGGKDSLVVWHLTHQQQQQQQQESERPIETSLLYVSDGFYEYESNTRLQELISCTSVPNMTLVKHHFHDSQFLKYSHAYLEPCGHPWAALVLFDASLIALLQGYDEVSLGYEKSADEGNGVFVGEREVNHQYDKSSVFMALAQQYIHDCLSSTLRVFSPLMDLWELEVSCFECVMVENFVN